MDSMTPSILVAPPSELDPTFSGSVIVLCGHQKNGSLGFILNHPISLTIKDLLEGFNAIEPIYTDKQVFFGGPVEKNYGFVMYEHEPGKSLAPGFSVAKDISITPARKVLEMAAEGKLDGRFELMLGYASWSKGQLWHELKTGSWLHMPFFQELMFDVPPEDRWQQSFTALGISPYSFMSVKGGAQA